MIYPLTIMDAEKYSSFDIFHYGALSIYDYFKEGWGQAPFDLSFLH